MIVKQEASYKRQTAISLVLLWIGAVLLMGFMFYGWLRPGSEIGNAKGFLSRSKEVFIDQLLLSREDMQLGDQVYLINPHLSREMNGKPADPDFFVKAPAGKKKVYSSILQNKLKKAAAQQTDGFTIKPLPR